MKITKVIPIDKKRSKIFIDNKLAFVLYKGELRQYSIYEDADIDEVTYKGILTGPISKRALLRCSHLLEKRDYTSYELVSKLEAGFYPKEAIDYAISKLIGYGYINDDNYTRRYLECYIEKKSLLQIKTALFRKGISKEIIDKQLQNVYEDGYMQDEKKLINQLLIKRHYFEKNITDKELYNKEYVKQFNYLRGKGFSIANIREALGHQLDIT